MRNWCCSRRSIHVPRSRWPHWRPRAPTGISPRRATRSSPTARTDGRSVRPDSSSAVATQGRRRPGRQSLHRLLTATSTIVNTAIDVRRHLTSRVCFFLEADVETTARLDRFEPLDLLRGRRAPSGTSRRGVDGAGGRSSASGPAPGPTRSSFATASRRTSAPRHRSGFRSVRQAPDA